MPCLDVNTTDTSNHAHTKRRNRWTTLRMNSLVQILHNKRLENKNLKRTCLKNDEDSLLCDDLLLLDKWLVDNEVKVMSFDLEEDLNVDFIDVYRNKACASNSSHQQKEQKIKKGYKQILIS